MPAAKDYPTILEIKDNCKRNINGCWLWQGALANNYPCMRRQGILLKLHRVTYELHYNTELGEQQANHKCNNKRCVNPTHIKAGNAQTNAQDNVSMNPPKGGVHFNKATKQGGWRANITINGNRYRKQFPTKQEAIDWLDSFKKEVLKYAEC